jgi:hypothetical protein
MPIYIARVKKCAKTLNSSCNFGLVKLQTDLAFLANSKQMFVFHILLMFAKLANSTESVLRMQLGMVLVFLENRKSRSQFRKNTGQQAPEKWHLASL